jgi:hypothetical protein
MRGRSRARWALLATLLVPFLAGCPGEVDPNTADPSAPELSLDAYGIPAQPGASSSPNPETIDTTCCDVLRQVRPSGIDLVAGAVDAQSGIQAVEIWMHGERTACVRGDGTGAVEGPGLGTTAAQTRSDADGIPSLAPDRLVARYQVTAYARAHNWAGQTVQTKRFTLRYAYP